MLSDVGLRRQRNEDAIDQYLPTPDDPAVVLGQLFVLADGVGGLSNGNVASREAVREVIRAYYDQTLSPPLENSEDDLRIRLKNAVMAANTVVYGLTQDYPSTVPMATTLVIAVVRGDVFAVASVGDSPAFLVHDGQMRKLTVDHNFAEMQWRAGRLSYEEAHLHPDRNKLMRAVGSQSSIEVDIVTDTLAPGDYLLLCSDGLTKYVSEEDITAIINSRQLDSAVQDLVSEANARGGFDNVSVIAIQALNADGSIPHAAGRGRAVMGGPQHGLSGTLTGIYMRRRLRRVLPLFTWIFACLIALASAITRVVLRRKKHHSTSS
jgi:protein phosphatase